MALVFVLAHVSLHVEHQRVLADERFTTNLALVLDGVEVRVVGLHMLRQHVVIRAGPVAQFTNVLVAAVFHVRVVAELAFRVESLVTDFAEVGVLSKMAPPMGGQLRVVRARVSTHVAHVLLLAGVHPLVAFNTSFVLKNFSQTLH